MVRFALSVLTALFLQTMYGAVVLLIVGQCGGDLAEVYVSAVSTGSQIMHTLTIVITGFAMGLTVFVGHKIGAGRRQEAGRIIGSGIWLFGIIAAVMTVVMVACASGMAALMQASAEAFDALVNYIVICSVGAAGAAMTTVLAQALNVLLSLMMIRRLELPFSFSIRDIRPKGRYVRQIVKLGTPIALQDLLVNFTFLVLIAIANSLGINGFCRHGSGRKTCSFLMLVSSAYMQSMSAFVAQNISVKRRERARKALLFGIASSLAGGVITFWFSFFHGEILARIFAKETAVMSKARQQRLLEDQIDAITDKNCASRCA